jgi:hypothetical protein
MKLKLLSAVIACAVAAIAPASGAPQDAIRPGEVWLDTAGKPIQAHGGGIIRHGGRYYWFGEDRSPDNDPDKRHVGCYRSTDLMRWTNCGPALVMATPQGFTSKWVLERPKVFYNKPSRTFVMYAHVDDAGADGKGYRLAEVLVATARRIEGPYTFVRRFRPLGKESRDIGQFIDDDGQAYLIFESRPSQGFYIASLSWNYQDVAREVAFVKSPIEGGAIVHYAGRYFVLGSQLTGWRPNPNWYATATRLSGPWGAFADVAPPETNTYGSQSSNLLKVAGTRATTVIYIGDRWNPEQLWDSRYVWMPLEIGNGSMRLPPPAPWTIDKTTGVTHVLGLSR